MSSTAKRIPAGAIRGQNGPASNLVTADVFLDFDGQGHQCSPLVFNPHGTSVIPIAQLLGKLTGGLAQSLVSRLCDS
jgi:hypothetical protein